jgi:hypothetical protein
MRSVNSIHRGRKKIFQGTPPFPKRTLKKARAGARPFPGFLEKLLCPGDFNSTSLSKLDVAKEKCFAGILLHVNRLDRFQDDSLPFLDFRLPLSPGSEPFSLVNRYLGTNLQCHRSSTSLPEAFVAFYHKIREKTRNPEAFSSRPVCQNCFSDSPVYTIESCTPRRKGIFPGCSGDNPEAQESHRLHDPEDFDPFSMIRPGRQGLLRSREKFVFRSWRIRLENPYVQARFEKGFIQSGQLEPSLTQSERMRAVSFSYRSHLLNEPRQRNAVVRKTQKPISAK